MTYEEFKKEEDIKWSLHRQELERRGNKAYNDGLWDAVKWNPFKWWGFFVYRREI